MLRFGAGVLVMAAIFCGTAAAQEAGTETYHDLPSAGVSLLKPKGFEPADAFDGIQNPETLVSIMAVRFPTSFEKLSKTYQKGATLPQNVKVESRVDQEFANMKGCLVKASQIAGGLEVKKWVLLFGDESNSYMVIGNAPGLEGVTDEETVEAMKGTLLKTKLLTSGSASSTDDLPFEVKPEKLKVSRGPLKMLYVTRDGMIPIKKPTDPLMVIAKSTSAIFNRDPIEFLEERIKKDDTQKSWETAPARKITVAGLGGCIIETKGLGKKGDALRGYWAVLMDDEAYYLLMGTFDEKDAKPMREEFLKIVESFKVKKAAEKK